MTIFGEEKNFFHGEMTSCDHVTSQENCMYEDINFGKNWKPTHCELQKKQKSQMAIFLNLKIILSLL